MPVEAHTISPAESPPGPQHAWAMAAGARCDLCSLANTARGPVPPTLPDSMDLIVIAEAPGHNEIEIGRTLVGASGREIRTALQSAGQDLSRVGFTNACACAPADEMKKHLQECRRKKIPSAIECCRPRLRAELSRAKFAILMGGASLQGVEMKGSILKLRGTPVQIAGGPRAVPITHAAFVLRDEGRVMRPLFHADVSKAVRISRGGDTWRDPPYFVARSAAEIDNFLAVPRPYLAVDTETDDIDPWTCGLRRIGIGTDTEVMIYSPKSVHGHAMLPAHEIEACTRVFGSALQKLPSLVFHNYWGFDSIVLNQQRMPVRDAAVHDSMVGHAIGPTSELPHRLDFLGSMYTDAPFWKDDVKTSNVPSDEVLDKYLSFDVAVTYQAAPYVGRNLAFAQQEGIYAIDTEMWRIGRSMSALGVYINKAKQLEFAMEYQLKSDRLHREFIEVARREVNPNSPKQVQQLLYRDLGLPVLQEHMTDSGDASTDESTLLDLLSLGVDQRAEKIIHALLGAREAEKVLGTYTGHVENGDLVGGPPIHIDGRLRTTWRPGKTTGRWGSAQPVNMQNIIKKLRAMYQPAPGNVFVAADFSALELRILAVLSGDEPLMQAFKNFDAKTGPDVHIVNACSVFRCRPEDVTDEIRTFIKRFVYALSYGAAPPKIFQTLSLLRDDNLKPVFPHITLAEVERTYNRWWEAHPAIVAWQKKLIIGWRSRGFISSGRHGRKRYFIGGENHEEMKNFPIQSYAADLQNEAVKAFVDAYTFDYGKKTGLILQVHDQLVVECAGGDAERVKMIMEWAMQKRVGDMLFPAVAKIAGDWKAVS